MITEIKHTNTAYSAIVSDKVTGSLFRDVSRGVNLPREITIRHQDYTDSKTKKVGRRTVLRMDRYVELTDGTIAPVSGMFVLMVPKDANVVAGDISDVVLLGANVHGGHTPDHTDLSTAVFINGEQ